jgi:hypothetical protein
MKARHLIDNASFGPDTPYEFLMREPYLDPQIWMSVEPNDAITSVAVAGPRGHR